MHVMPLVQHTIEAEADEAEHSDEDPIEFIEPALLSQKSMRCLVKPNQGTVHQVTTREDQQYHQPPVPAMHGKSRRAHVQHEHDDDELKRLPADPVDLGAFA